jgi:hypothetical protein
MYQHGYRYPSIQTRRLFATGVEFPTATFDVDLSHTLIPTLTAGSGYDWTFLGSTSHSLVDFEGITKPGFTNQSMHNGVRTVHNLVTNPSDVFTTNVIALVNGNDYVVSMEGDGNIVFTTGHTGTLTGQAGKRVTTGKWTSSFTNMTMTVTGSCLNVLVEDVTGQANQNPSRYVSRGVDAYPWHGLGADGVKSYAVENGNTVVGDVVTEADGEPIAPSIIEGASIWRSTANYANTATGTGVNTTGTTTNGQILTVWLKGAGVTAVVANNGADGVTEVDEDTPYTFTSTGGTHAITITGTCDLAWNGVYNIQCEKGNFPTPLMKSSGSWTRGGPEFEYGEENYSDEMTVVVEFEMPNGTALQEASEYQDLLGFYDVGHNDYTFRLSILSDGTVQLHVADDTDDIYLYTTATVSAGKHKIAATRSNTGSLVRLYMDGVDVETSSSGTNLTGDAASTSQFVVGMNRSHAEWINGYMTRAAIYPEPFTEELLAAASTL